MRGSTGKRLSCLPMGVNWRFESVEAMEQLMLNVFAADGRRVYTQRIGTLGLHHSSRLDVNSWPAGTYRLLLGDIRGNTLAGGRFIIVR